MERMTARLAFGTILPVAAIMLAILCGLLVPDHMLEAWGPVVFMASIVLFGLPHGAVDHLVIAKLTDSPLLSHRVGVYILAYIGLVGLTLALWALAPLVTFAGFILLTWFHWGQGDAWFLADVEDAIDFDWFVTVAFRGALPMLVPLVAFPEAYANVADAFIAAAGSAVETEAYIQELRIPAAALVALLGTLRMARVSDMKALARELLESGVLILAFSLVHPVFAIGVYFSCWHAPRHILRLARDLYVENHRGLVRVLGAAIPLTLVSVAFLAALFLSIESDDLFSVYLALIAALTVPHVAVVTWMDREAQRLTPSEGS